MRFGVYGAVLRSPRVLPPAVGTVLASLPIGMLGLAILLLVEGATGSFATAGVVVAVFGVGTGLGIVSQGRLIDRYGPRPVLLVSVGAQAAALVTIAIIAELAPPWGIAGCAFVAGLAEPQAGSALRSMWPSLVRPDQRPAASALSSMLFELPVVVGPLLLAVLIRVSAVPVVILTAAALSVAGALLVALSRAARDWRVAPNRRAGFLGPLAEPRVRLITSVMAGQGLAVGLVQVSCAAFFADRSAPGDAGLLYALLSLGSLIGTALYGLWARPVAHWTQLPILAGSLAVMLVGAAFAPGIAVLAVWVACAGLLVGPISVRCFTDVERHTPEGTLAAASTTLIATGLAATSAGTALAGWLIDLSGTTVALLTAAAFLLLVGALLVLSSDRTPVRAPAQTAPASTES